MAGSNYQQKDYHQTNTPYYSSPVPMLTNMPADFNIDNDLPNNNKANLVARLLTNTKLKTLLLGLILGAIIVYGLVSWQGLAGMSSKDGFGGITGLPQSKSLKFPTHANFAGEGMPLDNQDVAEAFQRELLANMYQHSVMWLSLKRANRWFPLIEKILADNNLPLDYKYVVVAESNFENKQSPRGAAGFWQIMPPSGLEHGLIITDEVDQRYNVEKATLAAVKLIKNMYRNTGSHTNVLAAYNMGIGALRKSQDQQRQRNYYNLLLNTETGRYVYRIVAIKTIMENPSQYGYSFDAAKDGYPPIEIDKVVNLPVTVSDLGQWALQQGTNYKNLKLANPWLRKQAITVDNGVALSCIIPKVTLIPDGQSPIGPNQPQPNINSADSAGNHTEDGAAPLGNTSTD